MKPAIKQSIKKRKHWRQFALRAYGNFAEARRSAGIKSADGVAVSKATTKLNEWFGHRAKLVIQAIQRRAINHGA